MRSSGSDLRPSFHPSIKPLVNQALGTIRPSLTMSRLTANMQDRYDRLRKEFSEIDQNGDKNLTFDEVHQFLSQKARGSFDRNLALELFAKMDRNQDSVVTTEEFIWSYVDAERLITQRMNELRRQVAENTKQMEETRRKMIEARESEQLNDFGIMKGSVLTVNVVEAQNLKPMDIGGTSDPYVILMCERQKIETKYVTNDLNPVWNEVFTFQIEHGNDDLKVIVMDHDNIGTDDFEGQVSIPLKFLRDQMKHDQFFDLQGPKPNMQWQGRIHLGLQWIWSKAKYLEEVITQWQENIEMDKQELDHLNKQLAKLREPFGGLVVQEELVKKQPGRVNIQQVENIFSEKIENLTIGTLGKPIDWDSSAFYVSVAYLVLTIFVMFVRPDFPNVRYM